MKSSNLFRLIAILMLASMLVSACSSQNSSGAGVTEMVVDPAETDAPSTDPLTTDAGFPTQGPINTPIPTIELVTPAPTEPGITPTITPTLDPYSALIVEGLKLLVDGKYPEAMQQFNAAIKMDPSISEGYLQRGRAYLKQLMFAEAVTEFNLAINYNPNDPRSYNGRAVAYASQGSYNQAIIDFNKAIEVDPDYVDAYANLSLV